MRRNQRKLLLDSFIILIFPAIFLTLWLFIILASEKPIETQTPWLNTQICDQVKKRQATGPLCIDICIAKTIKIPDKSYLINRYYLVQAKNYIKTITCINEKRVYSNEIKEKIDIFQLDHLILDKISVYLDYLPNIDAKLKHLKHFSDVNKDGLITLTEATNLLWLLSDKNILFMLILSDKNYVSKIERFCGGCIETDEIINKILLKKGVDAPPLLSFIFSESSTPEWLHRCRISYGILEFYIDMASFNLNDELGYDSLYLCSPIVHSFGYSFENEAKLIDFDNLISSKQLKEKLNDKYCLNDLDCRYNKYCNTKCDLKTHKCTSILNRLQIIDYCEFIAIYLFDNKDFKLLLSPVVKRCLKLKTFNEFQNGVMYLKNDLPIMYDNFKVFFVQSSYWNMSFEYTNVINDLKTNIWLWAKNVKDPNRAVLKNNTKTSKLFDLPKTTQNFKFKKLINRKVI